jgi:hypothetical protein
MDLLGFTLLKEIQDIMPVVRVDPVELDQFVTPMYGSLLLTYEPSRPKGRSQTSRPASDMPG